MSNARDIIIRPIITEKSMQLMDAENKITFEVAKGANKTNVRQAVEEIFNVKVESVNIMNCRPKTKRMGRYVGKTSAVRKAIVKLPAGQEIKLFEDYFKEKYFIGRRYAIPGQVCVRRKFQNGY